MTDESTTIDKACTRLGAELHVIDGRLFLQLYDGRDERRAHLGMNTNGSSLTLYDDWDHIRAILHVNADGLCLELLDERLRCCAEVHVAGDVTRLQLYGTDEQLQVVMPNDDA